LNSDLHSEKQQLHDLVDQLPVDRFSAALHFLKYLCTDPVLLSLVMAPIDDEPYTCAQRDRDAAAEKSIAHEGGISHEEILHEFGL